MKKIYLLLGFVLLGMVQQAFAGWPIGKYRNLVIPSLSYYTSKDTYDGNGNIVKGKPGEGFTSYSLGLYAGIGVSRRTDVIFNVQAPLQQSAYRNAKDSLISAQSSGLGDMQVGVSYNIFNFGYTSYLSVMGSAIIPLYNNSSKPVALGFGTTGAELKLMYTGSIGKTFLKDCYYNFEAGYRRFFDTQGPNIVLYVASLGIPFNARNQMSVAVDGQYATSINKSFNPVNLAINRDYSFTKASLNYGHAFTRRFSVFVSGFYTFMGRNTGVGYGGSVQTIFKL